MPIDENESLGNMTIGYQVGLSIYDSWWQGMVGKYSTWWKRGFWKYDAH